jgi:Phosphate-induced protein 1 conserved region
MKRALLSITLVAVSAVASFGQTGTTVNIRKMFGSPGSFFAQADLQPAAGKISYHGGPIMLGTNALYIVYYGAFPTGKNSTVAIINDFFANVGGSGNYNVNTTYYDKNNNHLINSLSFSPANNTYTDNYSIGKNIGADGVEKIVAKALNGGHFPIETTAIYFVVTAPDVVGSEISGLCAFHSNSSKLVAGTNIIYSVIPDFGGAALQGCDGNVQIFHEHNSPNNNLGADDVLDSFMHELSESVTDPNGTAWFGPGGENGDLCNFNYGATYLAPNGTHANTHLGGRDFLVQTIFSNTQNACLNTLP